MIVYSTSCTGKYWPKVADERRKKPQSIMLADKNAPNEDVWRQVTSSTLRLSSMCVLTSLISVIILCVFPI